MSTQKWERGSSVTLQDNTSSALTSGSSVLAATTNPYDNANSSNLYFWGDVELVGVFTTAPTAGKLLELWGVPSIDGTNYADDPTVSGGADAGLRLSAVAVRNVTGTQRLVFRNCLLGPHKLKFYLKNGADQTMSNSWTLTLIPIRTQSA